MLEDVDGARRRLGTEREVTLRRLANLTDDYESVVAASRDTNADDEHDPEGATIAFERSQIGALVRQARLHLAEIDAAVARVDAGELRSLRRVWRGDRRGPSRRPTGRADLHQMCRRGCRLTSL